MNSHALQMDRQMGCKDLTFASESRLQLKKIEMMQSLKKYCLFVLLAVASTAQGQSFRDIEELKEMRKDLQTEDSLMRLGILKDETTGLPYFTGYSYNVLYDWDQYFEAIVQIYMGWPSEYIKNGVQLFLQNQREDGFIARSVPSNPSHDNEHVKPFLSQIALLAVLEYGEKDWILEKNTFERLKKYLDYWLGRGRQRTERVDVGAAYRHGQPARAGRLVARPLLGGC